MAMRESERIDGAAAERVAQLLQRRMTGESVARIVGEREFYGLAFTLNAATLEPRPETEMLVELALGALPAGGRLLDLGTGTGCIAIAILANQPDATAVATDMSADALEAAQGNAARNGVSGRLDLRQGDWFGALKEHPPSIPPHKGEGGEGAASPQTGLPTHRWGGIEGGVEPQAPDDISGTFDLIVSNPPYIASVVVERLEPEVKAFDPRLALDGGPDGLAPYRVIAADAAHWLKPGGRVLVEIGFDQGAAVSALFIEAGFDGVALHRDLNGLDRVVCAHHLGDNR